MPNAGFYLFNAKSLLFKSREHFHYTSVVLEEYFSGREAYKENVIKIQDNRNFNNKQHCGFP